jgi:hypothetical protein
MPGGGFVTLHDISDREALRLFEGCVKLLPGPVLWKIREMPVEIEFLPSNDLIAAFDPPLARLSRFAARIN